MAKRKRDVLEPGAESFDADDVIIAKRDDVIVAHALASDLPAPDVVYPEPENDRRPDHESTNLDIREKAIGDV